MFITWFMKVFLINFGMKIQANLCNLCVCATSALTDAEHRFNGILRLKGKASGKKRNACIDADIGATEVSISPRKVSSCLQSALSNVNVLPSFKSQGTSEETVRPSDDGAEPTGASDTDVVKKTQPP